MQVNGVPMSEVALFIHSTATGPFMWRPLLAELPEGVTPLTPVNRGYAPHDLLPRGAAFSVHDEVAHLKAQIPPGTTGLHLGGHSYGGFVALTLAQALAKEGGLPVRSLWLYEPVLFGALRQEQAQLSPDVAAQVAELYGADSMLDEADGGSEAWIERFIDYWNHPGTWARMPEKARAMTRPVGWKMFREVCSVSTEPQPFAHYQLEVPVTLVRGERTTPPARDMVSRLAEVNPQAVVETVTGLGHMGLLADPASVRPSLQRHWGRVRV